MGVWGTLEGGREGLRPLSGSTHTCVAQGAGAHFCAPSRLLPKPLGSRVWRLNTHPRSASPPQTPNPEAQPLAAGTEGP